MDPTKLKEMDIKICIPGMRLSVANKQFASGPGTYELNDYIYSSFAGVLKMVEDTESEVTIVTVESTRTPSILPKTGDIVTAKVTVVNPRQVHCSILCVGPLVLGRSLRGVVKKEDIKATDKDRIDPYKCFRPGDVILARVLPMTEIHWYHLATSENELGVVIATAEGSPQGVSMVPTSWLEMQCPQSLVKEPRKVARVIPEKLIEKVETDETANKEKECNKEADQNMDQELHQEMGQEIHQEME